MGQLWLLALALPVAGGLVASGIESDAWLAVTWAVWIAGPVAALLGSWAALRRLHSVPRALVSGVVAMAWSVVAILLWMMGVAAGEGLDL